MLYNTKKSNNQSKFLNIARREKIPVTLFLMNGFQLKGTIQSFDDYAVIISNDNGNSIVYKHAISTITPAKKIYLSSDENTKASSDDSDEDEYDEDSDEE